MATNPATIQARFIGKGDRVSFHTADGKPHTITIQRARGRQDDLTGHKFVELLAGNHRQFELAADERVQYLGGQQP